MTNFNSENFNTHERFSNLNSNSSIDYADFLFLDDSLFFDSYKINAQDYQTSDFPNSELVNPNIVFAKSGYNAPPIPFVKYSKFSFVTGIVNFVSLFAFLFILLIILDGDTHFLYTFIPLVFLSLSVLGIILSISALKAPYSHFRQGYRKARIGLIFNTFSFLIYVWGIAINYL
ncbi:hypothetical protein HCQ94_00350 [Actinomyces sp. zg-332]|uniref:hypothetical protein n=1 Tax=Actinomyces sp. zg-332 TaxID=2708340 RepID=UPI00141DC4F2|nr:hypothetical protein [Actinomyces sp. zg-332]QPK94208.1 hypothetical protein HCQ94_00350 [Actinomyces sp. zg-332]